MVRLSEVLVVERIAAERGQLVMPERQILSFLVLACVSGSQSFVKPPVVLILFSRRSF
jgi:hypothetical protein